MATYDSLAALFTATANAIRAKLGVSSTFSANDFPSKIASIPTGVQMRVEKSLILTRTDSSRAPSDAKLYVKYVFANEDDVWGTKIEELENGGSLTVPIPDMDYASETKVHQEDLFFIFFIMPAPSAPAGIFYSTGQGTTSGLVGTVSNVNGSTGSSEQVGYIAVHTDLSELSDGTASLSMRIQGR